MDFSVELGYNHHREWDRAMSQEPAEIDGLRTVARHIFEALCAQYPDKYIALVQPRDVSSGDNGAINSTTPPAPAVMSPIATD